MRQFILLIGTLWLQLLFSSVSYGQQDRYVITPNNLALQNYSHNVQLRFFRITTNGDSTELTNKASWFSSNKEVFKVSKKGIGSTLDTGSFTITASYKNGLATRMGTVFPLAQITVLGSIYAHGEYERVDLNEKIHLNVLFKDDKHPKFGRQLTNNEVSWSSSDASKAIVLAPGVIKAIDTGIVIIKTQYLGVYNGGIELHIVQPLEYIELVEKVKKVEYLVTDTIQFKAIGHYKNGSSKDITNSVIWSTGDKKSLKFLEESGKFLAINPYGSWVAASFINNKTSRYVNITNPLESAYMDLKDTIMLVGQKIDLEAMGIYKDGNKSKLKSWETTWSISDTSLVQLDKKFHSIYAVDTGEVQLSMTYFKDDHFKQKQTRTIRVVNPDVRLRMTRSLNNTSTIYPGDTLEYYLTGEKYSQNKYHVLNLEKAIWTSNDSNVASVLQAGYVRCIKPGSFSVEAKINDSTSTSNKYIVYHKIDSISISPVVDSFGVNKEVVFSATGYYSNGTSKDITNLVEWTSANGRVAKFSFANKNILRTNKFGMTIIRAELPYSKLAPKEFIVTVYNELVELSFSPTTDTIRYDTVSIRAIASYQFGPSKDVTKECSWTSLEPDVVQSLGDGKFISYFKGAVSVNAKYKSKIKTTTIYSDRAVNLIFPNDHYFVNFNSGSSKTLMSILPEVDFSYSGIRRITDSCQLAYTSSDESFFPTPPICSVDLSFKRPNSTTISELTANYLSTVGTTKVIYLDTSSALLPSEVTIPVGASKQLTIGGMSELNRCATWSSLKKSIAKTNKNGMITGTEPGITEIIAKIDGYSLKTSFKVLAYDSISLGFTSHSIKYNDSFKLSKITLINTVTGDQKVLNNVDSGWGYIFEPSTNKVTVSDNGTVLTGVKANTSDLINVTITTPEQNYHTSFELKLTD